MKSAKLSTSRGRERGEGQDGPRKCMSAKELNNGLSRVRADENFPKLQHLFASQFLSVLRCSFAPAMPSDRKHRQWVNKCRGVLLQVRPFARGNQKDGEAVIMHIARKLAKELDCQDQAVITAGEVPAWITPEVVDGAMTRIQAGEELGGLRPEPVAVVAAPVPTSVVPTPKAKVAPGFSISARESMRGCDIYLERHRDQIRDAALLLKGRGARQKLTTLMKSIAWSRWKQLTHAERLPFVRMSCRDVTRYRDAFGVFRRSCASASTGVVAAEVVETPHKATRAQLLQHLGQVFVEEGTRELALIPKGCARGHRHRFRMFMARVVSKASLPKTQKILKTKTLRALADRVGDVSEPSSAGKRTSRTSDEQLRDLLHDDTRHSSKWSTRVDQPMRVLSSSIKNTYAGNEGLHELFGYRQLCRRLCLRHPKAGIGKAHKRQDICSECRVFDQVLHPKVLQFMEESGEAIAQVLPSFFNDYTPDSRKARADCIAELSRFLAYVESQEGVVLPTLTPAGVDGLRIVVATILSQATAILEDLTVYDMHFRLRDALKAALDADRQSPSPGVLYIMSDWKAMQL